MLQARTADGAGCSDEEATLELHHILIAGYIVFGLWLDLLKRLRVEEEVTRVAPTGAVTLQQLMDLELTTRLVREAKRTAPFYRSSSVRPERRIAGTVRPRSRATASASCCVHAPEQEPPRRSLVSPSVPNVEVVSSYGARANRMNDTSVESYLQDGCGRCEHFKTPACKVQLWTAPLEALRALLLASGLSEEMKWGSPCYTLDGKNVAMLLALKDACGISFFKGAALVDEEGVLESPGANSHFVRYLKFRSMADVKTKKKVSRQLLEQAIALERAGTKIVAPELKEALPDELEARLSKDPKLRKAFDALTPGRRRSHVLHVSGAKQAETRERRVDRCAEDILAGRGFNERLR